MINGCYFFKDSLEIWTYFKILSMNIVKLII